MDFQKTIRDWALPIAMVAGASIYLVYHVMPPYVHRAGPFLEAAVSTIQPLLIFAMLFLTFCRIEPKELKPHRWHWWLLLIQGGLFTLLGLAIVLLSKVLPSGHSQWMVLMESAMLCLICPTATAAAVVTRKLGGDVPGITTYIILINILAAILVPLIVPLVQPMAGMTFWEAFSIILAKVLPLLMLPCFCAWLVRYLMPKVHRKLIEWQDLPFRIWVFALMLAIAVTTKAIVKSDMDWTLLLLMSLVSLVCCIFQFRVGRYVGSRYRPRRRLLLPSGLKDSDVRFAHPTTALRTARCKSPLGYLLIARDPVFRAAGGTVFVPSDQTAEERGREVRKVTAGQSLGQKNTVFAIWLGYTFMTPETAIVGGLYSIWHNCYNSWQLYRHNHKKDVTV